MRRTDSVLQDVSNAVPYADGLVQVAGGGDAAGDHEGDTGHGGSKPVLVKQDPASLFGRGTHKHEENLLGAQKAVHMIDPEAEDGAGNDLKRQELCAGAA
jgi:hypothetical protein